MTLGPLPSWTHNWPLEWLIDSTESRFPDLRVAKLMANSTIITSPQTLEPSLHTSTASEPTTPPDIGGANRPVLPMDESDDCYNRCLHSLQTVHRQTHNTLWLSQWVSHNLLPFPSLAVGVGSLPLPFVLSINCDRGTALPLLFGSECRVLRSTQSYQKFSNDLKVFIYLWFILFNVQSLCSRVSAWHQSKALNIITYTL